MPVDLSHLRPSPGGFVQLCATIVIAIILVLTGCVEAPDRVTGASGMPGSVAKPSGRPVPRDATETTPNGEEDHGLRAAGVTSRLALARRCSWAGNLSEGPPRLASYGRTRPRTRQTACRSNLPLNSAELLTDRVV